VKRLLALGLIAGSAPAFAQLAAHDMHEMPMPAVDQPPTPAPGQAVPGMPPIPAVTAKALSNAKPAVAGRRRRAGNAPPPASAGSGPARAADAIWGAEAMAPSRRMLIVENGGMQGSWLQVDRFEYRGRRGRDGYLWDAQGYVGGDLDKFWFKSEGEGQRGERAERIEVQALWSHAIRPFFDLQMGVLHDFAGRDRTSAVIGVQGIAPYGFEIDTAAFLSTRGDLTARAEVEIDQRITQRLILQPRAEIDLAAQDIPGHDVGRGLDKAELGLRLRYEFAREFAPYIGVDQEWRVGRSADMVRATGRDPSTTSYVVGVRFWF
jgi:copper resistance protein B